jgi:hypothetical protein
MQNRLTEAEEARFDTIMNRTIVLARKEVGWGEADKRYYELLRQESTEDLEWMVDLHATGKLERREETFNVMLEELAERLLLLKPNSKSDEAGL